MIYLFVTHECLTLSDINEAIRKSKPQFDSHKELEEMEEMEEMEVENIGKM